MEVRSATERKATTAAIAVALAAVGGLFLFARIANSPAPRLMRRTVIEATPTQGAFVRFAIEPSRSLLRLGAEGQTWEYRVAEPGGRIYGSKVNADENTREVDVPYAYGRPAVAPRLEVWHDDRLLGWTDLGSLPPPRVERLFSGPSPRLRAFHTPPTLDTQPEGELRDAVRFAPRQSLPPGEFWWVEVRRTSLDPLARTTAALRPGPPSLDGVDEVRLRYAADVREIRVRVQRWTHRSRTFRLVLRKLRLGESKGQTVLEWRGEHSPSPPGLDVRRRPGSEGFVSSGFVASPGGKVRLLEVQSDGRLRPILGDARYPALELTIDPNYASALPEDVQRAGRSLSEEWQALAGQVTMAFENPDFHHLHLRRLWIGTASWVDLHPDLGPIDRRPFDVTLLITKSWNERMDSFETTIPVEGAPSDSARRL